MEKLITLYISYPISKIDASEPNLFTDKDHVKADALNQLRREDYKVEEVHLYEMTIDQNTMEDIFSIYIDEDGTFNYEDNSNWQYFVGMMLAKDPYETVEL